MLETRSGIKMPLGKNKNFSWTTQLVYGRGELHKRGMEKITSHYKILISCYVLNQPEGKYFLEYVLQTLDKKQFLIIMTS